MKGFTLIELMLVFAIIAVIGTVSVVTLVGQKSTGDLTNTTQQIGALLREAQSNSMAQDQGAQWGVHFDNTTTTSAFFALFYTLNGTYASGTPVGHYALLPDLCFVSSTLAAGSSTDVIFNSISGGTVSTTIGLQLNGCGTTVVSSGTPAISRTSSGKIFFDDFNRSNL
jgi:prepilin-type N-terminal cleavage/methylation domain-containing protein